MTDTEIIKLLVTLVGLITTVAVPVIRLNVTLSKIQGQLENFDKEVKHNADDHKEFRCDIDDHETRIFSLEEWKKYKGEKL